MNIRWLRYRPIGMTRWLGSLFALFKTQRTANTSGQSGTIFINRKPKLRISLGIAIILAGIVGGIYLSIRSNQQDISLLVRIPRMITTPGGDTQRNSDQYQETVKLANQKNIAKVEDTSDSYILIPEVVTETIQVEEITDPLPWSTIDQETLSDQYHEFNHGTRKVVQPQANSPVENERNSTENLLAELNNSLNHETLNESGTQKDNFSRQTNSNESGQSSSSNLALKAIRNNNSPRVLDPPNEVSNKQSKYGLAVLNQMNAIANALAVNTPAAGFFRTRDDQNGSPTEPSSIPGNITGYEATDLNETNGNDSTIQGITAGSIFYAEVLSEVTSDFPTPILVEITHGLHKGWRLVGQFNTSPSGKGLLVSFNKLVDLSGRENPVSALAIDGIEGQSLIASKVEPRLLQRYGPVFATSFIAGLAESLAQPRATFGEIGNSQILVVEPSTLEQAGYAGLKNSFSAISSDIANHIPKGPLITIQSGHPIGILFTASTGNLN